MIAAHSPPVSEPRDRKFFLVKAIPLSCRSARLLSIESLPSARYAASASHRLSAYCVALPRVDLPERRRRCVSSHSCNSADKGSLRAWRAAGRCRADWPLISAAMA